MAASRHVSRGLVVMGITELVIATVCVIIGIVFTVKWSHKEDTEFRSRRVDQGIWMAMYVVPGMFSVIAGVNKNTVIISISLVFNIIATILSTLGAFIYIVVSPLMNKLLNDCIGEDICKEAKVFLITLTVMMVVLATASLIGSILSSIGLCCSPEASNVQMPATPQSKIVVKTRGGNNRYQGMETYDGSNVPPPYGMQFYCGSRDDERKPLLENMVI